jgi:AraC-like DNA-binding protein
MIASAIRGPFASELTRAGLPSSPNVLLVDCDEPLVHRFSGHLGDIYHLRSARSERQLWRTLEDHAVDLIIINLNPNCARDSLQTCSSLKSSVLFAHLPVILLIPEQDPDWIIPVLDAGADAWIEHPLHRDYLRARIRNIFANRSRTKKYFEHTSAFTANTTSALSAGELFIRRLNSVISENLADQQFNVDRLACLMNMSRPTLYRKVKTISEGTPNELINSVRLEKAAELLTTGTTRVLAIVKMVGFNSRSNFGKAFTKHFGVTPKEYRQLTAGAIGALK